MDRDETERHLGVGRGHSMVADLRENPRGPRGRADAAPSRFPFGSLTRHRDPVTCTELVSLGS